MNTVVPLAPIAGPIERRIFLFRAHRVMLDSDLAQLYGVETGALNRAVKRNPDRFPGDFMFRLTKREAEDLRCQTGISKQGGGRRYRPYVFTEQGVAMLSGVLHSRRAIRANVEIMRAFVRLRQLAASHQGLVKRLGMLERKYDRRFRVVFEAIRRLMEPPSRTRRSLGFRPGAG